jgi:hypothetical protein
MNSWCQPNIATMLMCTILVVRTYAVRKKHVVLRAGSRTLSWFSTLALDPSLLSRRSRAHAGSKLGCSKPIVVHYRSSRVLIPFFVAEHGLDRGWRHHRHSDVSIGYRDARGGGSESTRGMSWSLFLSTMYKVHID